MITEPALRKFMAQLGLLRFFPTDVRERFALEEMIVRQLVDEDSQLDWLGKRMLQLYNDWPGPHELRAVYCSKFKPKEGPSNALSSVFCEGIIPSEEVHVAPPLTEEEKRRFFGAPEMYLIPEGERKRLLAAPETKTLADGRKEEIIGDPESKAMIEDLAKRMPKMPRVDRTQQRFDRVLKGFERLLLETITAPQDRPELPGPTPQIITEADADRAAEALTTTIPPEAW